MLRHRSKLLIAAALLLAGLPVLASAGLLVYSAILPPLDPARLIAGVRGLRLSEGSKGCIPCSSREPCTV